MHGRSGGYSWRKGLEGEKTVNKFLEGLPQDYFIFYDVKLPGSKGNIDNINYPKLWIALLVLR